MIRDVERLEKECIEPGRIGATDYRIRQPVVFNYYLITGNPDQVRAIYPLGYAYPDPTNLHIEAFGNNLTEVRNALAAKILESYLNPPSPESAEQIRARLGGCLICSPFWNRVERMGEEILTIKWTHYLRSKFDLLRSKLLRRADRDST